MQKNTKFKVALKNGLNFSGSVLEDNEQTLSFTDKFGHQVIIAKSEVAVLEVLP